MKFTTRTILLAGALLGMQTPTAIAQPAAPEQPPEASAGNPDEAAPQPEEAAPEPEGTAPTEGAPGASAPPITPPDAEGEAGPAAPLPPVPTEASPPATPPGSPPAPASAPNTSATPSAHPTAAPAQDSRENASSAPTSPTSRAEPEPEAPTFGAKAKVEPTTPRTSQRYSTASRMRVPLSEVPATVQVLEREQIDQRGAGDLNSALYYAPGINPVWRYGGFQQVRSRGFRAIVLNDGIRDNRSTFVNSHPQTGLWSLERIEILKGPSAVLYGYGSVGGVVNLIHKRPSDIEAYELDLALGTPGQRRAHVGATGPIADGLTHRIDLGHTYRRDFRGLKTKRTGGSLALAYQLAPGHLLSLRTSLAQDDYNTDSGIPTVDLGNGKRGLPAGAPLSARYNNSQDGLHYNRWDLDVTYEGKLSEHLRLTDRFSYARDEYSYLSSEYLEYVPGEGEDGRPTVRLGWVDEEDPSGNSAGYFYFFHHWFPIGNQLELQGEFDTGPVAHKALVGYEFAGLFDSSSDRAGNVFSEPFETLDWAAPTESRVQVPIQRDSAFRFNMQTHSLYAHEHANLPADLTLVLGARYDRFLFESRRDSLDVTGDTLERGDLDERDEQAVTGRAGLLYNPWEPLTGYLSFGTAFKPNASISARDRRIAPEHAKQLEAGVRFLMDERLTASAAVYKIWKRDVTIPQEQDRFETAGKISSQGLELDVQAKPHRMVAITSGIAWTDARYDTFRTSAGDDLADNRVPFAPSYTANLWLQLLPVENFGVGIGGRAMGQQYGDEENNLPLKPYYLVDAALWYRSGPARITLTVNNALDEGDFAVNSTYQQLTPGPQREVLARLDVDL